MRVLLIDGHPGHGWLSAHLLDHYPRALPAHHAVDRIAVRGLRSGYVRPQPLEPDLEGASRAILDADHLVVAHPLWWGGERALLKGLYDRVFLPGTTFEYHKRSPFWDKLLKGRTGEVLVTTDTPIPWRRLRFGNLIGKRLTRQVLGFCGIKPLRSGMFGPVRRGGADRRMQAWHSRLTRLAISAEALKRGRSS